MSEDALRSLADKYVTGSINEQEKATLSALLDEQPYRELLEKILMEEFQNRRFEAAGNDAILQAIEQFVLGAIAAPKRKVVTLRKWAAAAAILGFIAMGYNFYRYTNERIAGKFVAQKQQTILPGGNKATLMLNNGSTIILSNTDTGTIAEQGATKIIKTDSGKLLYAATDESDMANNSLNTLTTPRGGIFQLTLPDGTKVWLNAASSITYPTSFNGKEREVSITGEAYFEVATDKQKPFHVNVRDMRIDVLGTHFNINAYTDEQYIKTTLLQGGVKLTGARNAVVIKPGEQAQYHENGLLHINKDEDVDQVMAWKNGYFSFTDADLPTVMRQLERWYNIDVAYEGEVPQRRFQGELPRNLELSAILKVLTDMKIKYTLNERKLLITK